MLGGNPGGRIPGGMGPPGMGPPGPPCIGPPCIGPPCNGPPCIGPVGAGGCCMLGIKGMGAMGGWLPGACICRGGALPMVGGFDEGKLGVFGAYFESDARRSS